MNQQSDHLTANVDLDVDYGHNFGLRNDSNKFSFKPHNSLLYDPSLEELKEDNQAMNI